MNINNGDIYLTKNHSIVKYVDGEYFKIAGNETPGYRDGPCEIALFNNPTKIIPYMDENYQEQIGFYILETSHVRFLTIKYCNVRTVYNQTFQVGTFAQKTNNLYILSYKSSSSYINYRENFQQVSSVSSCCIFESSVYNGSILYYSMGNKIQYEQNSINALLFTFPAGYKLSLRKFGTDVFVLAKNGSLRSLYILNETKFSLIDDCLIDDDVSDFYISSNLYTIGKNVTVSNCSNYKYNLTNLLTRSLSRRKTVSEQSQTISMTESSSQTISDSKSLSGNKTISRSLSDNKTISGSGSLSDNKTVSSSVSKSSSENKTISGSGTLSENKTISVSETLSENISGTDSLSNSITIEQNSSSVSFIVTMTNEQNSSTISFIETVTIEQSKTLTVPEEITATENIILAVPMRTKTQVIEKPAEESSMLKADTDTIAGFGTTSVAIASTMSFAAATSGTKITATLKIIGDGCNETGSPAFYENPLDLKYAYVGNFLVNFFVPLTIFLVYGVVVLSYSLITGQKAKTMREIIINSFAVEIFFMMWCIYMPSIASEYVFDEQIHVIIFWLLYLFMPFVGMCIFYFTTDVRIIESKSNKGGFLFSEKIEWETNIKSPFTKIFEGYKNFWGFAFDMIIAYGFSFATIINCEVVPFYIFALNLVYFLVLIFTSFVQPNCVIIGTVVISLGQIISIAMNYKNIDIDYVTTILYVSVFMGSIVLMFPFFYGIYEKIEEFRSKPIDEKEVPILVVPKENDYSDL